jgi:hypothetical protein
MLILAALLTIASTNLESEPIYPHADETIGTVRQV